MSYGDYRSRAVAYARHKMDRSTDKSTKRFFRLFDEYWELSHEQRSAVDGEIELERRELDA